MKVKYNRQNVVFQNTTNVWKKKVMLSRRANNISIIVLFIFITIFSGCKKFVDIDPPTRELASEQVFSSDAAATGAVLGLYLILWDEGFYISWQSGLLSDELSNSSTYFDQEQLFNNEVLPNNSMTLMCWKELYVAINHANTILEGLERSTVITPQLKLQLEGETRFMRAFCYFYLTSLFGEVPIITTSDYRKNSVEPRGTIDNVYSLIIDDLIKARDLVSEGYITGERVRVNKSVVFAMLARVYLYRENWVAAENEATKVIANTGIYSLTADLDSIVKANNREAVFQFYPPQDYTNSLEGVYYNPLFGSFFLSGTNLSQELLNSFEAGDQRLNEWVGSVTDNGQTFYYSNKYKIISDQAKIEYPTILRLGEQYLIRSEARAQQNNISGAQADLNAIRNRAGLPNTTANDKASLLLAIEKERRVELFTEVGHRWFDLKRWNRANSVLGPVKTNWQSTDALLPIPEREILNNPNMTQNPGY